MAVILEFLKMHLLMAVMALALVILILRLFGIGKKIFLWAAIFAMANGSIYFAKTMG